MEPRYFTLCGAEQSIEDWVQQIQEIPQAFHSSSYDELMGSTPHPLRYWHQIPARWLKQDPGFKILLRSHPPAGNQVPSWVLPPESYGLETSVKKPYQKILIITHHTDQFDDWSTLTQKFCNHKLLWTCYGVKTFPQWPKEEYINMQDALFAETDLAQAFYDTNFWQGDTLSPLHMHLIQRSLSSLNVGTLPHKTSRLITSYYGTWHFS